MLQTIFSWALNTLFGFLIFHSVSEIFIWIFGGFRVFLVTHIVILNFLELFLVIKFINSEINPNPPSTRLNSQALYINHVHPKRRHKSLIHAAASSCILDTQDLCPSLITFNPSEVTDDDPACLLTDKLTRVYEFLWSFSINLRNVR